MQSSMRLPGSGWPSVSVKSSTFSRSTFSTRSSVLSAVQSRDMILKSLKMLCPESKDLALCRAILDAIEEEQLSIAQELHDTVCQSLSGLRLSVAALRSKMGDAEAATTAEFCHLK